MTSRHWQKHAAVLVLAACGAEPLRARAADPGPPREILVAIHGFMGSSHAVVLRDGVVVYTALQGTEKRQTRTTPTPDQWRQFRETLDSLRVWQWRSKYPNPGVADGLRWDVDLTYADRSLHVEGDSNFPDDEGKPVNSAQPTSAFQRLREAVQKLIGDASF